MGLFKKKIQEEIKANPEPIEPFETPAPQQQQPEQPQTIEDVVINGLSLIYNNQLKILDLEVENRSLWNEMLRLAGGNK